MGRLRERVQSGIRGSPECLVTARGLCAPGPRGLEAPGGGLFLCVGEDSGGPPEEAPLEEDARLCQAHHDSTPCDTSGYNTGPGRCSDPSCLVLQPEGRRSAAEPWTHESVDGPSPGRRVQCPREMASGHMFRLFWFTTGVSLISSLLDVSGRSSLLYLEFDALE